MFLLSRTERRAWRRRRYEARLSRLSEVETTPAVRRNGCVITVMMTQKPDPQRGAPIASDFLNYIRPWWTTVNRVGLKGVLLHDGLPEEFTRQAATDNVTFVRCDPGPLPILHQRHFAVRDYLAGAKDDFVLVTDVSDVAFKRDPFEMIERFSDQFRLFMGSEVSTIGRNRCLRSETRQQYGELSHSDRTVMNPGILGGRRTEVLAFLELLTAEILRLGEHLLASDMCIVNRVIHTNYRPEEICTGAPLHSRFRRWEYHTSAAVMHK